jgi:hypothetical protein
MHYLKKEISLSKKARFSLICLTAVRHAHGDQEQRVAYTNRLTHQHVDPSDSHKQTCKAYRTAHARLRMTVSSPRIPLETPLFRSLNDYPITAGKEEETNHH